MVANIPKTELERIVVIGGGFAGIEFAKKISDKKFQVILLDKQNFHQFQPLFYQVATAGLEPSAISFPFRKLFQNRKNFHLRVTQVAGIDTANQEVYTDIGIIPYDKLVIAIGTTTNFYENVQLSQHCLPLKSTGEALNIRNTLFTTLEKAVQTSNIKIKKKHLTIVIVGGGPTGVEVAGSLADMRRYILPKDYPEINFEEMDIYLIESSPRVLNAMKDHASSKATLYLKNLNVKVLTGTRVASYDGNSVILNNGEQIETSTVIWAAGVIGNSIKGIEPELILPSNRIKVNRYNQVESYTNVFALGDIASMSEGTSYPAGHPQVAQVAIQQARLLGKNISAKTKKEWKEFTYSDLGSMATIGRNLAVVEFPTMKFSGFFAWCIWMFVHLMSLVGTKNKLQTLFNWVWSYFSYDQSLRLIINSVKKIETIEENREKTI